MKKLNLDFFFQIALLGFFLLLIGISTSYPLESRIYPQGLCAITSVFLLISLVRHFRERIQEKEADPEGAHRYRELFQVSVVIIIATAVGLLGGFLLGVLGYYVAYALFKEKRSHLPKTLGIGVALTVIYYILFGWVMNVPLLRGWLVHF